MFILVEYGKAKVWHRYGGCRFQVPPKKLLDLNRAPVFLTVQALVKKLNTDSLIKTQVAKSRNTIKH